MQPGLNNLKIFLLIFNISALIISKRFCSILKKCKINNLTLFASPLSFFLILIFRLISH